MRAYRAVRAPHDDDAPRWNVAAGAGLALLVASATGAPAAILWLGLPGGGSAARAACPATPSTRPTSSCRAAGTSPAPDRSVSGRAPNSPSPEAARPAARKWELLSRTHRRRLGPPPENGSYCPEPIEGGSARRPKMGATVPNPSKAARPAARKWELRSRTHRRRLG